MKYIFCQHQRQKQKFTQAIKLIHHNKPNDFPNDRKSRTNYLEKRIQITFGHKKMHPQSQKRFDKQ